MAKKKEQVFKIYNVEQADEEIKKLISERATFETIETASTVKIRVFYSKVVGYEHKETKDFKKHLNFKKDNADDYIEITEPASRLYWYLENSKSNYFLILLNKLRTEIEQNYEIVEAAQFSEKISDVKYFQFANEINEMQDDSGSIYALTDVYEADISHAYYRAAFVLGFISKSLYLEIVKNITKSERLRLLGCIASVKTTTLYKEGVPTDRPIIKSSRICRDAWFKICHYIDSALIELKGVLGKDFLFYWVDGIYFRYTDTMNDFKNSEHWHAIRRIFYKYNVEFKCVHIPLFNVINNGEYLEINLIKPDGKVKRFFPERKQIKTYSLIEFNPELKSNV